MRLGGHAIRWRPSRSLIAGVFAVAGISCIAVVAATQQRPVEPALTTSGTSMTSPSKAVPSPTVPATPRPRAARGPVLVASAPKTLVIPAIGVSSSLLTLGQATDGSIAVPSPGPDYDRAGWYRYSPTPGELGPAVIVGHIDSKRNGPSVFFRLGELKVGHTVRIARADSSVALFEVTSVRRFPKKDFPTALVYGNTDHAALRLITCGGPFDDGSGHYLDNVVVTAALVR